MIDVTREAEIGKAKADIRTLQASLLRFKIDAGVYPTSGQGLAALVKRPSTGPVPRSWRPYLMEQALIDPWGRPCQFRSPGQHNPFSHDIFSLGPDGQEGTEDDLGNW